MEYVLTMIMCAFIEGKTSCMPPHTFDTKYEDGYSCMLDGYTKAYDKTYEGSFDGNWNKDYVKAYDAVYTKLWEKDYDKV